MAREIKKILVIKLSALGDFVLALAAMKRIREAHKRAHITLLTTPQFEGLAKSSPYFNAVETDGKPSGPGAWLALLEVALCVTLFAACAMHVRLRLRNPARLAEVP